MGERLGLSRRKFLTTLAVGGSLAALGYFGLEKELNRGDPSFDESYYLNLIHQKEAPNFPFGLHTERVKEDYIEAVNYIGRVDLMGVFVTFEEFFNPVKQRQFFLKLKSIRDLGVTPVISIGFSEYISGLHPFDPKNRSNMRLISQAFSRVLDENLEQLGLKDTQMFVRYCYEANMPSFTHGRNKDISYKDHAKGFKETFTIFKEETQKKSPNILYAFSPWLDNDFESLYTPDADAVGFSMYDPIPTDYIMSGKRWAREVVEPSLYKMNNLTKGNIPLYVWEIGSYIGNSHWLYEASLISFAYNAQGIMHFNIDKSMSKNIRETDWRMTLQTMYTYKSLVNNLNIHE